MVSNLCLNFLGEVLIKVLISDSAEKIFQTYTITNFK